MKVTLATTLGEIMKNPKTAAVFEKYKPGSANNTVFKVGQHLTLEKLSTYKHANLPPDVFTALMAELEALGDV
ncbi:MAG: hypothetical protein JW748_04845 [Anaerolineales bacterium]|nr:hypothetical protein [Anaerolineales bacterium]